MPRQTPLQTVQGRLADRLPGDLRRLPHRWQRLGDVLVLRGVSRVFGEQAEEVARVYAETLGARLVLEDLDGVSGALREPTMKRLWGTGSAETTFTQDRIRYTLDAERLMFSSGNLSERQRMGRLDARTETVVDLFAGIGYFTLPLLVHAGAREAIACELNPIAAHYLEKNAAANGVADRLEIRVGDCRAVAPRGVGDRVVAGWFPHGHEHLETALNAVRPTGGLLHYHDTAHAARAHEELTAHLHRAAGRCGRSLAQVHVRIVKNYAPGVVHAVADARVAPIPGEETGRPGRGTPPEAQTEPSPS